MDIKDRLHAAMELRSVNQTELARLTGVSPQAVQKWLSKKDDGTVPRMSKIKTIAAALQVPESWLLSGVGSPDKNRASREKLIFDINNAIENLDVEELEELLLQAQRTNAS